MSAPYNPPVKGEDYQIYIALADMANPGSFKSNPTIASGDFKVSKDGGALANLTTLPSVAPAASVGVSLALSATEMTADAVLVVCIDQTSPKEWADFSFAIQTVTGEWLRPTSAGNTLDVTATGAAGIDWGNLENPTTTVGLTGTTHSTSQAIASVSGAVGSVTGAVGSVTGAVGSVTGAVGSVTGAVGSVASGGITNASLAADTGLKSIRSNTAQAGAGSTITLDASASAVDNFYMSMFVYLTGGTGSGQVRLVSGYVGSTKVATVDHAWGTNPDNTTTFAILAQGRIDLGLWAGVAPSSLIVGNVQAVTSQRYNTAQAATSTTLTLDAGANGNDNFFNDCEVYIVANTGLGQSRLITGYVGSTKAATITPAWVTTPDSTSQFVILPGGREDIAQWLGVTPNALVSGRVDSSVGAIAAGQIVFKKNTAFTGFMFVLTDSSDHFTPKTGVTVTATRSLDGAAFAACTNSATEIGSTGVYHIDLSTTDLNAGNIMLSFTGTGADKRLIQVFTQP